MFQILRSSKLGRISFGKTCLKVGRRAANTASTLQNIQKCLGIKFISRSAACMRIQEVLYLSSDFTKPGCAFSEIRHIIGVPPFVPPSRDRTDSSPQFNP